MIYRFDEFELDLQRYELRCRGRMIKLEPQVFDVLAYLIQHRHQMVTKDELVEHVWDGRLVSEATLTSRLMAARRAVGDRGREQRVIQTLHGRGYRFIAGVEEHPIDASMSDAAQRAVSPVVRVPKPSPLTPHASSPSFISVVGREVELAQLQDWLQLACDGARQIVFITGEAGLGKTTVVDAFIEEARDRGLPWIGRGQCIEHYGAGETYMPMLEAFGQLCRGPDGQLCMEVLARQAPTWLVQLPWLSNDQTYEALQRRVQGATRERMLREMAEAIEVLTVERPLVLVLDDLHWSDYATLDLVALLAQRREPARFLLLGTYRPESIRGSGHPLPGMIQTLQLRQHCQELVLSALSATEVETYLAARLNSEAHAATLGPTLYRRTEGNPLFMVNLLKHWMAHGWLSQHHREWTLRPGWEAIAQEIPATLRELVTQRQARLSPTEQRLLEVASVSGLEFSAASVAAGMAAEVVETETWCEDLTRRREFLQTCGVDTWADGTVATRYRFRHALYQDVVYERIPAARQAQLHQRIGTREEAGYGERCGEIAARLAMHFERGQDLARAVRYHHLAAQQAMQRSGYQEAIGHLNRGLELLGQLPPNPDRAPQELAMQMALGGALRATKAYGAPDVKHAFLRARELCRQLDEPPEIIPVLYSLYELDEYVGAFERSGKLGEEILHLAHHRQDATFFLGAYDALACTAFHLGAFAQVLDYTERGLSIYDPQQHRALASLYGKDLGVSCQYWSAMALWFLGYPDQALQRIHKALTLAQEFTHPYTLALVHNRAAFLGQFLRHSQATRQWAEVALVTATEHGLARHAALAPILRGWALSMQEQGEEGIAQIRQGIVAYRGLGMAMEDPYFLALLAEAHANIGRLEEERAILAEALLALPSGRDFFYKAELYRLQGELLWQRSGSDDGQMEVWFQQALEVAQRQQAKSLELRAATSLSRLWLRQGKRDAARQLLTDTYGWFTEGFDTIDLQEARGLLDGLGS